MTDRGNSEIVRNSSDETVAPPRSLGEAIKRALTLRCPMCSRGLLFSGWIHMNQTCDHCRFRFEREPGYFLGSTYINYGLTTVLTTWSYLILYFGVGLDRRLVISGVASFCLIFPVVFFRYARSLWLSIDCFLDKTGAMESRADAVQKEDPGT